MALIEIDIRDCLDACEWRVLRKEALDDLLNERGPRARNFINDLVDARSAILVRRHAEALHLIERVLDELRDE